MLHPLVDIGTINLSKQLQWTSGLIRKVAKHGLIVVRPNLTREERRFLLFYILRVQTKKPQNIFLASWCVSKGNILHFFKNLRLKVKIWN